MKADVFLIKRCNLHNHIEQKIAVTFTNIKYLKTSFIQLYNNQHIHVFTYATIVFLSLMLLKYIPMNIIITSLCNQQSVWF